MTTPEWLLKLEVPHPVAEQFPPETRVFVGNIPYTLVHAFTSNSDETMVFLRIFPNWPKSEDCVSEIVSWEKGLADLLHSRLLYLAAIVESWDREIKQICMPRCCNFSSELWPPQSLRGPEAEHLTFKTTDGETFEFPNMDDLTTPSITKARVYLKPNVVCHCDFNFKKREAYFEDSFGRWYLKNGDFLGFLHAAEASTPQSLHKALETFALGPRFQIG